MSLLDGGLKGKWVKKPKALNEKQVLLPTHVSSLTSKIHNLTLIRFFSWLFQALAAIGQGHLIALWDSLFSRLNQPIAQILLTRGDLADVRIRLKTSSAGLLRLSSSLTLRDLDCVEIEISERILDHFHLTQQWCDPYHQRKRYVVNC